MQEFLTDIEVAKIEAFNADTVMVQAVKKVLLQHIYTQGVIKKGQDHNPLKNRALVLVGGKCQMKSLVHSFAHYGKE